MYTARPAKIAPANRKPKRFHSVSISPPFRAPDRSMNRVDHRGDYSGLSQSVSCGGRLPHHEESSLRGLGAHVSLDRSEDPRPCPLLRDGPDSGRVAAARSAPCRPGAQFGGPRSGTFLDLRSHQSLRPDFGEGGPLSSGHYLHRADTHEQPSRRNFPIGRLQGALVTTPAGASDRPHSRARLDVFRSCWVPTDDNPETRASGSLLRVLSRSLAHFH